MGNLLSFQAGGALSYSGSVLTAARGARGRSCSSCALTCQLGDWFAGCCTESGLRGQLRPLQSSGAAGDPGAVLHLLLSKCLVAPCLLL